MPEHMPDTRAPDPAACTHEKTRLIAKDDNSTYIECLVCGEILEAGELKDGPGFDESLSDA